MYEMCNFDIDNFWAYSDTVLKPTLWQVTPLYDSRWRCFGREPATVLVPPQAVLLWWWRYLSHTYYDAFSRKTADNLPLIE